MASEVQTTSVPMSASMDTRDFLLCFLCQSSTSETLVKEGAPLVKPSLNKRLQQHPEQLDDTLINLIENIHTLKQLDEWPHGIYVDDIDLLNHSTNVSDDVNLLRSKDVVWHKACTNKVDNQKVERAQLKRMNALAHNVSPVKTRILSNPGLTPVDCHMTEQEHVCLICDKAGRKNLRKAATLGIDAKVRRCASIIGNKILLRKLSSGDMIAIDAAYHLNCLTKLYRDAANIESADYDGDNLTKFLKAQAFAELVDYIESQRGITAVFKMSDIVHLYSSRLVSLG